MTDARPPATGTHVIAEHTLALADLADAVPASSRVPTCGEWTMADLTWHLATVQDFWAGVVRARPARPAGVADPVRPDETSSLPGRLRQSCANLVSALEGASPAEEAWSWADHDQTVGFTLRRQSHEALVHHIDGVLAAGHEIPDVPADLAADGVDELVDVFLGDPPPWTRVVTAGPAIWLQATDAARHWAVSLVTVEGTPPGAAAPVQLRTAVRDNRADPRVVVTAPALELDLWLWGRLPTPAVTVQGDAAVAGDLRDLVALVMR